MATSSWTVITAPPSRAERWVNWMLSRRSIEMPLVFVAMAVLFLWPLPDDWDMAVRFVTVGFALATAIQLWERRGFRELLGRHEAELAHLRDTTGSAP